MTVYRCSELLTQYAGKTFTYVKTALTKITSNKMKFKWPKIEQDYFDEIKRIVVHNILSY